MRRGNLGLIPEVIVLVCAATGLPGPPGRSCARQSEGVKKFRVQLARLKQSSAAAQTQPERPAADLPLDCNTSSSPQIRGWEKSALAAINQQRLQNGLSELLWSDPVADLAREQSCRMMRLGFFSHDDPERGVVMERLTRAGILFSGAGENIDKEKGYTDPAGNADPPAHAIKAWMSTHGHRMNVLDRSFDQAGLGITVARDSTYFLTAIFIVALPPPPKSPPSTRKPEADAGRAEELGDALLARVDGSVLLRRWAYAAT